MSSAVIFMHIQPIALKAVGVIGFMEEILRGAAVMHFSFHKDYGYIFPRQRGKYHEIYREKHKTDESKQYTDESERNP